MPTVCGCVDWNTDEIQTWWWPRRCACRCTRPRLRGATSRYHLMYWFEVVGITPWEEFQYVHSKLSRSIFLCLFFFFFWVESVCCISTCAFVNLTTTDWDQAQTDTGNIIPLSRTPGAEHAGMERHIQRARLWRLSELVFWVALLPLIASDLVVSFLGACYIFNEIFFFPSCFAWSSSRRCGGVSHTCPWVRVPDVSWLNDHLKVFSLFQTTAP